MLIRFAVCVVALASWCCAVQASDEQCKKALQDEKRIVDEMLTQSSDLTMLFALAGCDDRSFIRLRETRQGLVKMREKEVAAAQATDRACGRRERQRHVDQEMHEKILAAIDRTIRGCTGR